MNYLKNVNLDTSTADYIDEINKRYSWWINGNRHRIDGPAYIDEKKKIYAWCINGKSHREDGPSFIDLNNKEYCWYINGIDKTKEITQWLTKNKIDWLFMTREQKVFIKIKWK